MRKLQWLAALLCAAAVLAAVPAGAEMPEIPKPAEAKEKEYRLVFAVSGPAEVTITHPGGTPDAEPVTDAAPDPAAAAADYLPPGAEANPEVRTQEFRLPEGPDYRVELSGTGEGTLAYTVTLQDPSGEEEDRELFRFENIAVTEKTRLTAVTAGRRQCTLLADADGDGKLDAAYGSGENSIPFTVTSRTVLLAGVLILVIAVLVLFRKKKKVTVIQKPILERRG